MTEKEMANSAVLERAHTRQGSQVPGRVINLDQARVRHGDRADHMVRMLAVGDPLADAVIVEMDALGKEGRRILNAGLADGLESLTESNMQLTNGVMAISCPLLVRSRSTVVRINARDGAAIKDVAVIKITAIQVPSSCWSTPRKGAGSVSAKHARNLAHDGRLTLTLPLDHGLCEMRLRATAKKQEGRHRCFTAVVEDVRQHRSQYANVVSAVTFRLHDPTAVLARWSRQIEMLRGLK
jgi:hypothetical protein